VASAFRNGDRIRVSTVDDDGVPIVRYGTVGAELPADGPVVVLFDDLLGGDIVDRSEIVLVSLDSVELRLRGADLLTDESMRSGLAAMWRAEADVAGLSVAALFAMGDRGAGVRNGTDWLLAEFTHFGDTWIVRASILDDQTTTVVIRADRSNRWDGFIH
jgi:hypothetical protein